VIARLWSARTTNADAYQALFRGDIVAHLREIDGFRGGYLLRREFGSGAEFVTVTLFESLAAVRGFAGEDYESAAVSAQARKVLDDIDESVRHFTVVVAPDA
jgi:heme-degrading monooxygenase HmoA